MFSRRVAKNEIVRKKLIRVLINLTIEPVKVGYIKGWGVVVISTSYFHVVAFSINHGCEIWERL